MAFVKCPEAVEGSKYEIYYSLCGVLYEYYYESIVPSSGIDKY